MKKIWRFCLLVLVAHPWLVSACAAADDIHARAKAVDDHYNHLRTLQADFTQIYRGNDADRTESGELSLKKPGKMRWEYRSPKEKLFLSDGKNAWFYVPGDRQVRKTSVNKLDDLRSPLAFLLGKTKLEKELQGLSFAPDVPPLKPGDVVLRGVPRALAERVGQIVLEVTPENYIARIIIEETDGATTEYRFENQRENIEISDKQFNFVPPAGTEVIQGEFGQ